LSATLTF